MNLYINKELAVEKKLMEGNSVTEYNNLENFYKYLFETYISSKVDLKKYSKRISDSDLSFTVPTIINPCINDLNEYFNFDYIYTLNNFFIEKLSEDELNLLREAFVKKDSTSKELFDLVERTYKEIIKNNYINGTYVDNEYNIGYGKSTLDNFARNNSIVFKIYYSVIDKNDNKEEFLDRFNKVNNFITELKDEIKKEVEEKLNINCDVLTQLR